MKCYDCVFMEICQDMSARYETCRLFDRLPEAIKAADDVAIQASARIILLWQKQRSLLRKGIKMNKEKQIEEIVQDVDKAIRANFAWDVLAGGYVVNKADNIAQELYYADYRKIYDDNQRQCVCYALGCQMAEGLKRDVAREFIEAVDSMMECITAMIGCSLTYYGKYAELKKKYTKEITEEVE